MPTQSRKLDPRDAELARAMFLDGECYAFAAALHRGLGWPLVGLMAGSEIRHAGVRHPGGWLVDVRGLVEENDFGKPFGMEPPLVLRAIEENEMRPRIPFTEDSLLSVYMIASALLPDLPWKPTSPPGRIRAFVDALEALSRQHRIWIYAPIEMQAPVLSQEHGDEVGYALLPCNMGSGRMFNRVLKR